MVRVLVELDEPRIVKFGGYSDVVKIQTLNLTDDDLFDISRGAKVSIKELYKQAWRNVRCVRSLDDRATTVNLEKLGYPRSYVTQIISDVIEQKEDRQRGETGWVNYFNYRQFSKRLDVLAEMKKSRNLKTVLGQLYTDRIGTLMLALNGAQNYLNDVVSHPERWYDHQMAINDAIELLMDRAEQVADYETYVQTTYI